MYRKTILCLANSRKTGGTCVAGKELVGAKVGGWVRPVSARPTHEIAPVERRYKDGTLADVREVIDIPLEEHDPLLHQTENHVIDLTHPWRRAGVATWQQIQAAVDAVDKRECIERAYESQADNIAYVIPEELTWAQATK